MKRLRAALAGFLLLSQASTTPLAATNQYIEDFTTTTYKDAAATTALWDTGTGELKLPPFVGSIVGTYNTSGTAYRIAVSGDLAFVADDASGLQIINITDPANPTLTGTYNTPGNARGVVVAGDLAFVADGGSGLQIINITNPASPTLKGTYNTPVGAYAVAVAGDLAFVADATTVQIINITNPAAPTLTGTFTTFGVALDVTVAGDLAFVAAYNVGLEIVNITNPANPVLAGSYDTPVAALSVAVAGDLAFVADDASGLLIINIANPAVPTLIGTYDTPGTANGVKVAGDLAFVSDNSAGLQVIDITTPASPTLVQTYDTPGLANGVAVAGANAFVADGTFGLQVVTFTDPAALLIVGSYTTPGTCHDVVVAGDLAFVADGVSGLQIVNVANPANPTLTGTYNTPGDAQGVAVAGDLALVADGSTLQIINIANPASPTLTGTYTTPGSAQDVVVAGDLALVADGSAGLRIINIANPAGPTFVGTYDTPGTAMAVAVAGDLAFVADYNFGLQIINITNPASPTLTSTYSTGGWREDVAVAGDLAFACSGSSVDIINIANPVSPVFVGATILGGSGIAVEGDVLFTVTGEFVSDNITNPTSPEELSNVLLPSGPAGAVAVAGEYAFVMKGDLQVIPVFDHNLQTRANVTWSLPIYGSGEDIVMVRLSSTQTAAVTWVLSGIKTVTPDEWTRVYLGSAFDWRCTLKRMPGIDPVVSALQIDWRYESATPVAIDDIPGDQGGWVRLQMLRSGFDFTLEPLPIAHYGIWRRVDDPAFASTLAGVPHSIASIEPSIAETFAAFPLFGHDGRVFIEALGPLADTFPPGTWEWVGTVPALQQDTYLATVPTEADSTVNGMHQTVLVVTAHTTTPSIWFTSPPDSGYSIDNIAPAVPTNFAVAYNGGGGNALSWDPSPDDDFQYFRVYRSTDPNFTISPGTLVDATISTSWSDPDYNGGGVYYQLTAVDYAGNESGPAGAGTATAVGDPPTPRTFALYPNVPNPFNPQTHIVYDVPEHGGPVSLRVYDVGGRLARTLVEGTVAAGHQSIDWDGRDNAGRPLASGVYFYRLAAPGYTETRKMTLLR